MDEKAVGSLEIVRQLIYENYLTLPKMFFILIKLFLCAFLRFVPLVKNELL